MDQQRGLQCHTLHGAGPSRLQKLVQINPDIKEDYEAKGYLFHLIKSEIIWNGTASKLELVNCLTVDQQKDEEIDEYLISLAEEIKIQNGLTSRTQAVEAPMMRILQLEAPVTVGGPKVMKRVYNQAGAELGLENYKVTMRQDFALQMMLAYKCFFGGYTAA